VTGDQVHSNANANKTKYGGSSGKTIVEADVKQLAKRKEIGDFCFN
jgi:hypothetical protein